MVLLLVILAACLLTIGIPFFASLAVSTAVALAIFQPDIGLNIVYHRMFNGMAQFALLAIPFFIFAAEIIVKGTMATRLVKFVERLVGHLPGGLAMTTIMSCTFFGAVSGSTQATPAARSVSMLACTRVEPSISSSMAGASRAGADVAR